MSRKLKKNLIRIIIALILFLIVLALDKIFDLSNHISNRYGWIALFGLYLIIYIYIGYDVLSKSLHNIRNGQIFDENFLMSIATLGAFGIAIYKGILVSKGRDEDIEGFDEACAVLLFYQVGEWFQSYAVQKSRKDIKALMNIRPDYANIVRDNLEESVSPEDVHIGDIIVIHPGEKIPLDGIVIKGQSSIDAKSLTGESIPVDVFEGNEILSGTLNLTSDIWIKVTKEFYDSTVSKILNLVENASNQKSKTEAFITKFARIYTPIVVISALLIAIIPPTIYSIIGDYHKWDLWIYKALSFLVVSCPCALVISIPLAFFAGIGAASANGVLVKGSNYLELLNKSNIFVFDKTGTLTKGNLSIKEIIPLDRKDEIIRLAAIAEKNSNHPIGRSIVGYYDGEIEDYILENDAGYGIIARNGSDTIYCGNKKLMDKYNISCEDCDLTSVHVARNGEYIGLIILEDEIKKESKDVISYLNKTGKTIMLTGDNIKTAEHVSKEINLTSYKASLLPQDKVYEIEKMIQEKNQNDVLVFVGDGINDAPSLMMSDIGISMGGVGSDAAIEASDIVLMNDDLNGIIKAKKIAKKTMRISLENIIFAIGVKILILILSVIGIANMYLAVFGDVGVACLAILNSMRVNSKYK